MKQSVKTPKNKKQKDTQMPLHLRYSGIRVLDVLRFKISRTAVLLDHFSFWRSPLLWLIIFINITVSYLCLAYLFRRPDLPPAIPLLYFSHETSTVQVTQSTVYTLFFAHLVVQALVLYSAARLFYKVKHVSFFILISALLTAFLFYTTILKSILLTLPVP
ncbi:MAG: hypothetical protein PHG63_00265 [Candidatus Dojkabacteria bacterium]|nr:hypothetical protein [Candidatus Dojkabacteria bacterium]